MKRIFSTLLVIAFVLLLAGCAKSPSIQSNPKPANQCRVFNINGSDKDIGDYLETEELFLMEFEETHGITDYKLYDASELTAEILENRKGTWVIERCIGLVTDKQTGDGKLLNYADPEYYYISYRGLTEKYCDGTIVLSYMVYSPANNYTDDIIERFDFVICREYED